LKIKKNVVKFKRKLRRRRYFRLPKIPVLTVPLLLPVVALFILLVVQTSSDEGLVCDYPSITDGDTLKCDGIRVRLVGIDTPEMPGHCRAGRECVQGDPFAAKDYLESITRTTVRCVSEGLDHYGRTLARCDADGIDLSCAMLDAGHAERRYGFIICW